MCYECEKEYARLAEKIEQRILAEVKKEEKAEEKKKS